MSSLATKCLIPKKDLMLQSYAYITSENVVANSVGCVALRVNKCYNKFSGCGCIILNNIPPNFQ